MGACRVRVRFLFFRTREVYDRGTYARTRLSFIYIAIWFAMFHYYLAQFRGLILKNVVNIRVNSLARLIISLQFTLYTYKIFTTIYTRFVDLLALKQISF